MKTARTILVTAALLAAFHFASDARAADQLIDVPANDVKISWTPPQGKFLIKRGSVKIEVPGHEWVIRTSVPDGPYVSSSIRWTDPDDVRTYTGEKGVYLYLLDCKENARIHKRLVRLNASALDRESMSVLTVLETNQKAFIGQGEPSLEAKPVARTKPAVRALLETSTPDPSLKEVMKMLQATQDSNAALKEEVSSLRRQLEAMQSREASKNSQGQELKTTPVANAASAQMP